VIFQPAKYILLIYARKYIYANLKQICLCFK
jgi:hypothetical protein